MERPGNSEKDNIAFTLPVKIQYSVLEDYLRSKMKGENVKVENEEGEITNYARILDVSLERSPDEDFHVLLDVKFQALTSLFHDKEGRVLLYVILGYEEQEQQIKVEHFELKGKSKSWIMNKSLQAMANTFMYEKLKKKMRFDFEPLIQKQLEQINEKLENRIEPAEGFHVSGRLSTFSILEIFPGQSHVLVSVRLEGRGVIDITGLNF